MIDDTHDPLRRSWVDSANRPASNFPIQNLPFGVFRRRGAHEGFRVGVAIGDQVLDLAASARLGLMDGLPGELRSAIVEPSLNALMALGTPARRALRGHLADLLDAKRGRPEPRALAPVDSVELGVPAVIGDYTDFYASVFHATRVGRLFRPDNPLLPNYKFVPIAYHGRASSIVVSGTPISRPHGQAKASERSQPEFGPTRMLDYEVEIGAFVGAGNVLGRTIPIDEAEEHLFGLCVVNDWSARDIQAWEYQPLGPFLAKSFATTISPWIVTLEALAPFRCAAFTRPPEDPPPLPYLQSARDRETGSFDVEVDVELSTARMREQNVPPARLAAASLRDTYWTIGQMVTHHGSNGCNLRPGDLLATGTLSGASEASMGCLLELTVGGRQPVTLPGGERRTFLEDGDEVTLRGVCTREGFVRIGFGTCQGRIVRAT